MKHFPFAVRITFELDGIVGRESYAVAATTPEVAFAIAGWSLGLETGARAAASDCPPSEFRIRIIELSELAMEPQEVAAQ